MSRPDRRILLKPSAALGHPGSPWEVTGPSADGSGRWSRLFASRAEAEAYLREVGEEGEGISPETVPQPALAPPAVLGGPANPPLTLPEKAFLGCAALTVFASSWLLGGRFPWTQWTMLVLAALSLLAGTLVWLASRARPSPSLAAWRGWWISGWAAVAFVSYVAIQSFNPSHTHVLGHNDCILIPIPHQPLLPSSIDGPFAGLAHGFIEMENASRSLLVYGAALMGGLALMLGIQSRNCLRKLLVVVLAHGIVSAVICVAHQWSGSTEILWIRGDIGAFLGAPFFFNKNQNAAYQTLLAGIILYFAAQCFFPRANGRRRAIGMVLFAVAIIGVASIRSRAGVVFAGVLAVTWLLQHRSAIARWWRVRRATLAVLLSSLLVAGGLAFWKTGGVRTVGRFGEESFSIGNALHGGEFRRMLHQIAIEMFKDRPWYGWGAGSHFYTFARYEKKVPEMAFHRPGYSYFMLTHHADGDWYEFLAEFGVIGTGIFVAIWVPHLGLWIRRRVWKDRLLSAPAGAVVLILLHAFIDQSFRNVGLLCLHLGTAVLVTKMTLLRPPVRTPEQPPIALETR